MVTVVWFTAILQHIKVSRLTTIYNFSNIKGIQSNSLPCRARLLSETTWPTCIVLQVTSPSEDWENTLCSQLSAYLSINSVLSGRIQSQTIKFREFFPTEAFACQPLKNKKAGYRS